MVGLDSIDTYVPLQSKHFQENSHIILAEPGYIYLHTCTLSSCVVRTVSYVVELPLTDCPSMGGRVNGRQSQQHTGTHAKCPGSSLGSL